MKKRLLILFCLSCCFFCGYAQESVLQKKVSVEVDGLDIQEAIREISRQASVNFTYNTDLIQKIERSYKFRFCNVPLGEILSELVLNTNLGYIEHSGQVILRPQTKQRLKPVLKGKIVDAESKEPIPYAVLQLKNSLRGSIADINGNFNFEANWSELEDSIVFSSIGHDTVSIIARHFLQKATHTIYLKRQTIHLETIDVKATEAKLTECGNKGGIISGSLYVDTHGQQTALYIENPNKKEGVIRSVKFYLSKKGNTTAPFRVRIYAKDSLSEQPGKDLLPQILVVVPEVKKGWYSVDLSKFEIVVPRDGFFVAMEGVFPNDIEFYQADRGFTDVSEGRKRHSISDYANALITYGQRLAYNRKKGNNSWHLSISNNWFQIPKRNFNVMIAADVGY